MANRYAVATGNWSALATWDGGASLPGAADDVYANNFTVTIDQDITVLTLRTSAAAPAVAGGGFVVSTIGAGVTRHVALSGNLNTSGQHAANSTYLLTVSAADGTLDLGAAHLNAGANNGCWALLLSGTCKVKTTGTLFISHQAMYTSSANARVTAAGTLQVGAILTNANIGCALVVSGAGATITVDGDVNVQGYNAVCGVHFLAAGTLNVGGSIRIGEIGNSQPGIALNPGCVLNVTGGIYGGAFSQPVVAMGGAGTYVCTIGGDVQAGAGSNALYYSNNSAVSTLTVGGKVLAGGVPAINCSGISGGSVFNLNGGVEASGSCAAVSSAMTDLTCIVSGTLKWGSNGHQPMQVLRWKVKDNAVASLQISTNVGGLDTFTLGGTPPATADVRNGTVYGSGSLTGTLKVPAASSVAAGVLVDSGVGTGALHIADVAQVTGAQLVAAIGAYGVATGNGITLVPDSAGDLILGSV